MAIRRRKAILPTWAEVALEYVYVIIGSAFVALAFSVFLLPNAIASGGVSGISTILYGLFGWKPSYVQWAFNIPLFIAGLVFLGRRFGAKTLVGTIVLPLFVYVFEDWGAATKDPLLGALFGGLGIGAGLGIVFRGKASTGGVDLLAQIIHKYIGISLGTIILLIDGTIVLSSAIIFGIEQALYALIAMFLTAKTIDVVQMGLGTSKMALIISDHEEELRKGILTDIYRGVTKISAFGGYTQDERPMLMCVVAQHEVTKLKQYVRDIDPSAFIIVVNAHEVLGEGFKRS
ncbi:YitT family protein [Fictibacillus iocasae]|uniref:YitT family protein n=1 Tax=Fictibacillus iocasae TaxID=2715437 RepID=A0ABW2NSZ2_9BACL